MATDNENSIYYAWIPILTYSLNFNYFIKKLEREGNKITEDEARNFDKKLSKNNGTYYNCDSHEDVENKSFRAVISINDEKILDHILILDKTGNLEAHAVCDIDKKGLVTLKLKYPDEKYAWKEYEIIKQFYIITRDLYHYHTHHKAHEDLLLKPVIAKSKKDAIEKILNQYDEKIIKYHKRIRLSIPHEKFDFATKLIVTAKGEMTYASHFVNLFKEDIEDPEFCRFVFSNALRSIAILANEIKFVYTAELNTETIKLNSLITGLTLAVVVLTLPIAIDATFGFLYHFDSMEISDIIKFFVSLFYFSTLLFIIYRLRDRIKKEFEKSYKILIGIIIVVAVVTIAIIAILPYVH